MAASGPPPHEQQSPHRTLSPAFVFHLRAPRRLPPSDPAPAPAPARQGPACGDCSARGGTARRASLVSRWRVQPSLSIPSLASPDFLEPSPSACTQRERLRERRCSPKSQQASCASFCCVSCHSQCHVALFVDLFVPLFSSPHRDIDLKTPARPPAFAFVTFESTMDAEDAVRGRGNNSLPFGRPSLRGVSPVI